MLAFPFASVLRILLSPSDVMPNASLLRNLINDQNVVIISGLGVIPMGIFQYLLYMCSATLAMNPDIRVLAYTSTKVMLISFFLHRFGESRSGSGSTPSVHLPVPPFVCPSATLLGCLVVTTKAFIPFYSNFAKWMLTY